MRSGNIHVDDASYRYVGVDGDYWTSTPVNTIYRAYFLTLRADNITLINSGDRYIALPVRFAVRESIQAQPLPHYNYVRSGNTNIRHAALRRAGGYSYVWSRTAHMSDQYNTILTFNDVGVNSSAYDNRYDAFFGRC